MISKRVLVIAIAIHAASLQTSMGDTHRIDAMLAEPHRTQEVTVTAVCDDATYLRRLSLDLLGRVPKLEELNAFLADPNRADAVERMLNSPEHVRFWSQLWTVMLIGRSDQQFVEREVLRTWLEQQLADQTSLQQVAFELISAQGVSALTGPVNYMAASREDPVMRLSRTFLAVRLDCAQCHDHPHDRWTNADYQAMTRFFQPVQYREVSGGILVRDSTADASTQRPVFLTGRQPQTSAWRRELGWMVVQSKPFSRAMVNRTWYWLMGRGIIDPVDDLSRDHPPVLPELLESLSESFRTDGYRLRPLIRMICTSQAYQREPSCGADEHADRQRSLFAARTVRPLLPEQWLASRAVVLQRPAPTADELSSQARQVLGLTPQSPVSDPYHWEANSQTLIRQLSLSIPGSPADLDSMYLSTVARKPTAHERELAETYSSQEILFALLHCNEFLMND